MTLKRMLGLGLITSDSCQFCSKYGTEDHVTLSMHILILSMEDKTGCYLDIQVVLCPGGRARNLPLTSLLTQKVEGWEGVKLRRELFLLA